MKIHVCVKQVPASNETLLDPVTHTIIRESAQSILNPFDAYAVEEAVRIKARCGGTVTAFTMGIPSAEETLRRVIAVGADDAVLLTDRAFAGSDTLATARTLAAAIRKKGMPDLILCGKMATDGDTAQVGPMLAECLGLAHVSDVAERCFEFLERLPSADETEIGAADVLVSVGQGIGGAENIALAEKLARRLGGTLSSSRPLVDSGVMPYARQVGQTGKTVAPKLYLALGISGAIQHMAGVAAKTIVAVNTDPDAPIFGYAHYAIRCDCGAFLRAMLEKN